MTEDKRLNSANRRQSSEDRRHRSRRSRHSSSKNRERKKTIKLLLLITGICLAIGLILSILIGKVPTMVETIVSRQIEGEIERTIGQSGANVDELKKKYKKFMK